MLSRRGLLVERVGFAQLYFVDPGELRQVAISRLTFLLIICDKVGNLLTMCIKSKLHSKSSIMPQFYFHTTYDLHATFHSLGAEEGSNLASGSATMNAQLPPDPRFPYANLLASDPVQPSDQFQPDLRTGYHPYYLASDLAASSNSQESSSQALPPSLQPSQAPRRAQISRQQHRLHPYQTSQSNILNRHTTARAHWDDVSSPDQDLQGQIASANSSAANTPPGSVPPAPPPLAAAGASDTTEGTNPKPTGRSGQKRRKKYTRTRTGCLCCRSRRIKCDEARPVCKRCTIAKRECVYPDGTGGSNPASGTDAPGGSNRGKGRSSGEDSESENDRYRKSRPGSPSALCYPPIPNGNFGYGDGTNVYDASALNMTPMSGGLVGNAMGGGMSLMEMGMAQQIGRAHV